MKFKANEIKASSLKVGVKYVLGTPMGKLNEKDIVEVKSITVSGNDIQINLEKEKQWSNASAVGRIFAKKIKLKANQLNILVIRIKNWINFN